MTRDQLAEYVWGGDYDPGSNVADVYVGYVRRKLQTARTQPLIHTVRGLGYMLKARGRAVVMRWVSRMPFRAQLTLWWALAFGLLLAVANLAIYSAFKVYLDGDLDRKVRTVAATELASSTDGAGIHLHPLAKDALGEGEFADTFVQILGADGTVRLASPSIRDLPPLVGLEAGAGSPRRPRAARLPGRRRPARPRRRAPGGGPWRALRHPGRTLPR